MSHISTNLGRDRVTKAKSAQKHAKLPGEMTPEELWAAYGKWATGICGAVYGRFSTAMHSDDRSELYGIAFEALKRSAECFDPERVGASGFCNFSKRLILQMLYRYMYNVHIYGLRKPFQLNHQKVVPTVLLHGQTTYEDGWSSMDQSEFEGAGFGEYAAATEEYYDGYNIHSRSPEELADFLKMYREMTEEISESTNVKYQEATLKTLLGESTPAVEARVLGVSRQSCHHPAHRVRERLMERWGIESDELGDRIRAAKTRGFTGLPGRNSRGKKVAADAA